MKNSLGHDNVSEITTVIERIRQNKFKIIKIESNRIYFDIILYSSVIVPISRSWIKRYSYVIENDNYIPFKFQELNHNEMREIPKISGYLI